MDPPPFDGVPGMTATQERSRDYDLTQQAQRWAQMRSTFGNSERTQFAADIAQVLARELKAGEVVTEYRLGKLVQQALTVEQWPEMVDVADLRRGDRCSFGTVIDVARPMVDWPFTGPATHWDVEYTEKASDDSPVLRRTFEAGQVIATVRAT